MRHWHKCQRWNLSGFRCPFREPEDKDRDRDDQPALPGDPIDAPRNLREEKAVEAYVPGARIPAVKEPVHDAIRDPTDQPQETPDLVPPVDIPVPDLPGPEAVPLPGRVPKPGTQPAPAPKPVPRPRTPVPYPRVPVPVFALPDVGIGLLGSKGFDTWQDQLGQLGAISPLPAQKTLSGPSRPLTERLGDFDPGDRFAKPQLPPPKTNVEGARPQLAPVYAINPTFVRGTPWQESLGAAVAGAAATAALGLALKQAIDRGGKPPMQAVEQHVVQQFRNRHGPFAKWIPRRGWNPIVAKWLPGSATASPSNSK